MKEIENEKHRLEKSLTSKLIEIEKMSQEKTEITKENNKLQQFADKLKKEAAVYKEKEESLINELQNMKAEIELMKEIDFKKHQLEKKLASKLSEIEKMSKEKMEITNENEKLRNDLERLQKDLSDTGDHKTTLKNKDTQIVELKESKEEMFIQLEKIETENSMINEENKRLIEERTELFNKISNLEEENASFHEGISRLTEQRISEDNRLDKITKNFNEVFNETKVLVSMTSTLKQQLEVKALELSQLKKEKQLLIAQVIKLKDYYEKSESRNKEFESNVEALKADFLFAKQSFSHIDQFESEYRQLKGDLKSKIEEMNLLTEKYEQDRGDLEKQIEQLKAKIVGLESNLKEKDNFIQQIIQQPLSQLKCELQPLAEKNQQILPQLEEPPQPRNNCKQQLSQQQADWFKRIMAQQQNGKQPVSKKTKNLSSKPIDFFTLKRETSQLSVPSSFNEGQMRQE